MPLILTLLACLAAPEADDTAAAPDFYAAGPWSPARTTFVATDTARDRTLTFELWYPTDAAPDTFDVQELVPDAEDRAVYADLLAGAPQGCPTLSTLAVPEASPALADPLPLIAMSHCHTCTRFSTLTVAEHLTTWGFVVIAADHAGNTLFDALRGEALALNTDTLALRADDISFVLNEALTTELVPGLSPDPDRIGLFGHSFGAVTVGMVLQSRLPSNARQAAMFVGAPPENPFLPGVTMADLDAPLLFESLAEDHSIGEAGNLLIESNFESAPQTAYGFELGDAGHWSPSDLVGVTESFMPGCGDDTREASGEPFTYLSPTEGKAITGALAASFFSATLNDDAAAEAFLVAQGDDPRLTAFVR